MVCNKSTWCLPAMRNWIPSKTFLFVTLVLVTRGLQADGPIDSGITPVALVPSNNDNDQKAHDDSDAGTGETEPDDFDARALVPTQFESPAEISSVTPSKNIIEQAAPTPEIPKSDAVEQPTQLPPTSVVVANEEISPDTGAVKLLENIINSVEPQAISAVSEDEQTDSGNMLSRENTVTDMDSSKKEIPSTSIKNDADTQIENEVITDVVDDDQMNAVDAVDLVSEDASDSTPVESVYGDNYEAVELQNSNPTLSDSPVDTASQNMSDYYDGYDDYSDLPVIPTHLQLNATDYIGSEGNCESLLQAHECVLRAAEYDRQKALAQAGNNTAWLTTHPNDCFRPQWHIFACWQVSADKLLRHQYQDHTVYSVNISWPKSSLTPCEHEAGSWRRDCRADKDLLTGEFTGHVEWLHDFMNFELFCPGFNQSREVPEKDTEGFDALDAQGIWLTFDRVLRIVQTVLTFSAFGMLLFLKRIHCTRIYIHMHLLLSFILRSILYSLFKFDLNPYTKYDRLHEAQDLIIYQHDGLAQRYKEVVKYGMWQAMPHPDYPDDETMQILGNDFLQMRDPVTSEVVWNEPNTTTLTNFIEEHCAFLNEHQTNYIPCKIVAVLLQYFVTANYFWLLVEGIYLSLLLQTSTITSRFTITPFAVLGWGIPLLSIIIWTLVMGLTSPPTTEMDDGFRYRRGSCWMAATPEDNLRNFQFIIQAPIILTLILNAYIFLSVVSVVNIKLKASNSDYKIRLARSTLSLIPLLGIQYVLTIPLEDLDWDTNSWSAEFILFTFILKSLCNRTPGILVSLIYCFFNAEVQNEFMARMKAYRTGHELQMDAMRRRSTISTSNISNPKNSISEMQGNQVPDFRRRSSVFVEKGMWFKGFFVKSRVPERGFRRQSTFQHLSTVPRYGSDQPVSTTSLSSPNRINTNIILPVRRNTTIDDSDNKINSTEFFSKSSNYNPSATNIPHSRLSSTSAQLGSKSTSDINSRHIRDPANPRLNRLTDSLKQTQNPSETDSKLPHNSTPYAQSADQKLATDSVSILNGHSETEESKPLLDNNPNTEPPLEPNPNQNNSSNNSFQSPLQRNIQADDATAFAVDHSAQNDSKSVAPYEETINAPSCLESSCHDLTDSGTPRGRHSLVTMASSRDESTSIQRSSKLSAHGDAVPDFAFTKPFLTKDFEEGVEEITPLQEAQSREMGRYTSDDSAVNSSF